MTRVPNGAIGRPESSGRRRQQRCHGMTMPEEQLNISVSDCASQATAEAVVETMTRGSAGKLNQQTHSREPRDQES